MRTIAIILAALLFAGCCTGCCGPAPVFRTQVACPEPAVPKVQLVEPEADPDVLEERLYWLRYILTDMGDRSVFWRQQPDGTWTRTR